MSPTTTSTSLKQIEKSGIQAPTKTTSQLQNISWPNEIHDNVTRANISLSIPMSTDFPQSSTHQTGQKGKLSEDILASTEISLQDMSRAVPEIYHQYVIKVLMHLPARPAVKRGISGAKGKTISDEAERTNACLTIEAPLTLLKDLNSSYHLPAECDIPKSLLDKEAPRKLLAHTGDHLPPAWCSQNDSIPLKLDYFQDEPLWTVYITASDKQLINMHLMATSVFLFVLVGIVVLVVFVRVSILSRKSHSPSVRFARDVSNSELPLAENCG